MISGRISNFRLYDALVAAIEDAIKDQTQALATGMVSDWDDYNKRRSRIEGLAEALDIAAEAEKKHRET